MPANVCTAIWVMIARNRASYCEFCSKMLEDVIKKYKDLLNEHIALIHNYTVYTKLFSLYA